ncbi:unnamed protein product [Calypogeia fissa]
MGNSEIESPLLRERDAESQVTGRISRVNNDYVALPGVEAGVNAGHAVRGSFLSQKGRTFLYGFGICCIAAILLASAAFVSYNLQAETEGLDGDGGNSPSTDNAEFLKVQRTSFHFQPTHNYMSDPCAPLYYKGWYHLFYQYNPNGASWGDIGWGHTVSKDLVHWLYLEEILRPTEWYDIFGAWSGYASIREDGSPVILYTGGRTAFSSLAEQSQNMALPEDPEDPLLRKWYKVDQNPIMFNPDFIRPQDFRDPTTAWLEDDGLWRVALGSRLDNPDGSRDGIALMYTSTDFYNWNLTDTILDRVAGTGMWECLDLYPILTEGQVGANHSVLRKSYWPDAENHAEHYHNEIKYVLKASMDELRHDHYAIGTYSLETHEFIPDDRSIDVGIGYRYDWGKFYASKTFFDPTTRRRILWGYVNESDSETDDITKGWACAMAIPRTVWLDPLTKSNLLIWPVAEVEKLRTSHTSHRNIALKPEETWKVKGGEGNQLDVLVTFERPNVSAIDESTPDSVEEFDCSQGGSAHRGTFGPFGVLVLADDKLIEHTGVFFFISRKKNGDWGTKVCSDQSKSSQAKGLDKTVYGSYLMMVESETELSLRILIDHSMIESFVQGGRFAITARVYPQIALNNNAGVFLFNNGTTPVTVKSVDVYKMGSVKMTSM